MSLCTAASCAGVSALNPEWLFPCRPWGPHRSRFGAPEAASAAPRPRVRPRPRAFVRTWRKAPPHTRAGPREPFGPERIGGRSLRSLRTDSLVNVSRHPRGGETSVDGSGTGRSSAGNGGRPSGCCRLSDDAHPLALGEKPGEISRTAGVLQPPLFRGRHFAPAKKSPPTRPRPIERGFRVSPLHAFKPRRPASPQPACVSLGVSAAFRGRHHRLRALRSAS